jgi:hypothetical protein
LAEKRARKEPPKGKKKTWASPRVKSGQLFESNSLACTKVPPTMQGNLCEDSGLFQS